MSAYIVCIYRIENLLEIVERYIDRTFSTFSHRRELRDTDSLREAAGFSGRRGERKTRVEIPFFSGSKDWSRDWPRTGFTFLYVSFSRLFLSFFFLSFFSFSNVQVGLTSTRPDCVHLSWPAIPHWKLVFFPTYPSRPRRSLRGKQEEWGTRTDQFPDASPSFGQFTILSRDRQCAAASDSSSFFFSFFLSLSLFLLFAEKSRKRIEV